MARLPSASTKTPAPSAPTVTLAFAVEESEGIKRAPRGSSKHEAYPQVVAAVTKSLAEKKALKFAGLPSEDHVRQAKNMLAQVQNSHKANSDPIRIKQNVEKHSNGSFTLHFQASRGAKNFRYTAMQIREWAAKNGYDKSEYEKKISEKVRDAFKVSNGYVKTEK